MGPAKPAGTRGEIRLKLPLRASLPRLAGTLLLRGPPIQHMLDAALHMAQMTLLVRAG